MLVACSHHRLGREVVKALLASGRNVVAAARSEDKIKEALEEASNDKKLWIKSGLDISLGEPPQDYFAGVSQVRAQ
jgi:NAD(P)-dependent dehydrogenase (short-subunit alcohol dehydrogenase family)